MHPPSSAHISLLNPCLLSCCFFFYLLLAFTDPSVQGSGPLNGVSRCSTWNVTYKCPTVTSAHWFTPLLQRSVSHARTTGPSVDDREAKREINLEVRGKSKRDGKKRHDVRVCMFVWKHRWQTGMLKSCQRQNLQQWWQQFEYLSTAGWWIGLTAAEGSLPLGPILMPQVHRPAQTCGFWVHGLPHAHAVLVYSGAALCKKARLNKWRNNLLWK